MSAAEEIQQNLSKLSIVTNDKWSKVNDNTNYKNNIVSNGYPLDNVYHTDILPTNVNGWKNTESFLLGVVKILFDYVKESNDRASKLVRFHHPDQLAQILDLKIPENPRELKQLLVDCEQVLKYQVKTGHPHFFNQISTGLDLVSMAGEWLTATANTNMFTYEISPVFILMEKEVMKEMIKMIDWPEGDGIFAPGGAISNLYAVNAARHNFYPRCKPLGMADIPKLAMFTSVDSHYSIKGAAAVCGIGTDNVFNIPVDKEHKMIPEALLAKIHETKRLGYVPFFVNATAGTTVYGAFDPIEQIADICDANNMWLHVDVFIIKEDDAKFMVSFEPNKCTCGAKACHHLIAARLSCNLSTNIKTSRNVTTLRRQDKRKISQKRPGRKQPRRDDYNDVNSRQNETIFEDEVEQTACDPIKSDAPTEEELLNEEIENTEDDTELPLDESIATATSRCTCGKITDEPMIECDAKLADCRIWYHRNCENVNDIYFGVKNKRKSIRSKLYWECSICFKVTRFRWGPVVKFGSRNCNIINSCTIDPALTSFYVQAKYNKDIWQQAAWGGGLLLSPKHRRLLKGVERAKSVTWNPHKLLGIHLQCSACFVRQDGLLFQCNQMSADYLFQQDKPYDVSYDTGDKAIQCGRHNDIFKFWLTWRAKGMSGYAKQINRLMDLAAYFTAKIKSTEGFEMVMDNPQFLNICFWYIPPSLRSLEPEEKKARLEKIAPKIKAKMMSEGTTMVGYQPDHNKPNFFRMVISNQAITKQDLDFLVTEIVRFGQDL